MISLLQNSNLNSNVPILDLSQAVPNSPPPITLQKAIGRAAMKPENYRYGAVLGKLKLRKMIAFRWNLIYKSDITFSEVGVTSGCNQAFCAAITSTASPGDSVILPSPWYFNHKMWLDMQGINILTLPCIKNFIPDFNSLEKLYNKTVKAIILVTPNNPTGQEYPKKLILKFAHFARHKNIALIIDETYRDFISKSSNLHNLFQTEDWRHWLIHLYSFSKAYRIPGQRIGAIVTGQKRLENIKKFLDTLNICPNLIGQDASIYGLKYLTKFIEEQRLEIINKKQVLQEVMSELPNWQILSIGAYFAYIRYPFPLSSIKFCELLLKEQSVLVMPGSFFEDKDSATKNNDQKIRIAFANIEKHSLFDLAKRLKSFERLFYDKYCFPQKTSLEDSDTK